MLFRSRTALRRLNGCLGTDVPGNDDADDRGVALAGGFNDAHAIDTWHAEVRYQRVERHLLEHLEGALAIRGLRDVVPLIGKPLRIDLAKRRFIVDEKNVRLGPAQGAKILTQLSLIPKT